MRSSMLSVSICQERRISFLIRMSTRMGCRACVRCYCADYCVVAHTGGIFVSCDHSATVFMGKSIGLFNGDIDSMRRG